MKKIRMPRLHVVLLCVSIVLGLIACTIEGTAHRAYAPVAQNQWQKERGPVVPHDSFPRDCSICHEGESWHVIKKEFAFDHSKETGVALVGAHQAAECLRCHNDRGPVAEFSQRGCVGCHEDIHRARQAGKCTDCHTESNWLPNAQVVDHQRTRFPLVGSHVAVACFACHEGAQVGNFDRTSIECVDCHSDQIARATNPDHTAQGWVDKCDRCHIPTTWDGAGFNHFAFPLTGAHADVACNTCHPGNVFTGTPSTCVACHQSDFDSTANPDHAAAGFPTTCERCHSTNSWSGGTFSHSFWPLTGAHSTQTCNDCHSKQVYMGTPSNCVGCHQTDFDNTASPNHTLAGFPTSCGQCHNTASWTKANFDHTGVVSGCVNCHLPDYNGATSPDHAANNISQQCQQCHGTTTWAGASFNHTGITAGCVNCHLSDYNGATSPNHVANNISQQCQQCHSTTTWDGAAFNHRGVTSGCVDCHLADYNGATSPNHVANNIPQQCQQCHTTTTWLGATFNHRGITNGCVNCHLSDYNGAISPLNHAANNISQQCQQCHSTTTWAGATFSHRGITSGCITCHQNDYSTATSPNHLGLGYPTSCQTCHNTTTWNSSTFNHQPYFPIASGHHSGFTCTQCHPSLRNPATFTCLSCHTHNASETNSHHQGVSGYSYNSNACYQCHPTGQGD